MHHRHRCRHWQRLLLPRRPRLLPQLRRLGSLPVPGLVHPQRQLHPMVRPR